MTVDKLLVIKITYNELSGQTIRAKNCFTFCYQCKCLERGQSLNCKFHSTVKTQLFFLSSYLQNIQKNFLIAVTLIHSFFLTTSPICPKIKPEMNRAK